MIPWIQVHSNLITHPKTSALADQLRLTSAATIPNVVAAGMLVSLWTWAIQNAYNGDLSGCSDRAIAEAARYRKSPKAFVDALIASGFLDEDRKLHDWEEYTISLTSNMDRQKEKTRQRVKRYRDKKTAPNGAVVPKNCNVGGNVTVTQSNAHREEKIREDENLIISHVHNTSPSTDTPPTVTARPNFDGKTFSAFWDAYPAKNGVKVGREAAWEAWRKLAPNPQYACQIVKNLQSWKLSGQWLEEGGRYIPSPDKFLASPQYRDASPAPAQKGIPKGASGELGKAELEAIRMILAEGDSDVD